MSAAVGRVRRAAALPLWQPFRRPAFRNLWLSETISLIGDQFHFVALAWLAWELTGSGLALGSVLIAAALPRAILLLPSGALADRLDPRRLMLVAHVVRGLLVGALAVIVLAGAASLPVLIVFAALFGAADAFAIPSQSAILPRLVPAAQLAPANAAVQGTMQLTSLVGPVVGGVAVAAAGTGPAFVIDAVSFWLAALVLLLVPARAVPDSAAATRTEAAAEPHADASPVGPSALREPSPEHEQAPRTESLLAQIRAGLRYTLADPAVRTMLILSLVLNLAVNGPVAVGLPVLAAERFDAGPVGIGWLFAGWAGGALVGTIVAGSIRDIADRGRLLLVLVGLAGAGIALVGVGGELAIAVAVLAGIGTCIGVVNVIALSWVQGRVEPAMLGRVMSLAMLMGIGASPLSHAIAGVLVDLDPTALYLGAGALTSLAVALGVAVRLPSLMARARPDAADSIAPGTSLARTA